MKYILKNCFQLTYNKYKLESQVETLEKEKIMAWYNYVLPYAKAISPWSWLTPTGYGPRAATNLYRRAAQMYKRGAFTRGASKAALKYVFKPQTAYGATPQAAGVQTPTGGLPTIQDTGVLGATTTGGGAGGGAGGGGAGDPPPPHS